MGMPRAAVKARLEALEPVQRGLQRLQGRDRGHRWEDPKGPR